MTRKLAGVTSLCARPNSRAPEPFAERQASSFLRHVASTLANEHGSRFPVARESKRVLRTLRTQLPAETIGVHALQGFRDAALVSINEPGDFNGRRGMQRPGGADLLTPIGCGYPRACHFPRMALVRLQICDVWLGAGSDRTARMGLIGLERGAAQGQGMVHAQAADLFASGRRGADAALVGTGRSAAGTVSGDDRQISRSTRGFGMVRRAGGCGALV